MCSKAMSQSCPKSVHYPFCFSTPAALSLSTNAKSIPDFQGNYGTLQQREKSAKEYNFKWLYKKASQAL